MSKRTHKALTSLFQTAMDSPLPRPFQTSIRLMVETGLPAGLFRFIPPLRRIEISDAMAEHHYLGAYFGSRLEHTPGTENVDWKLLGWDGEPRMMLFPHIPPEWVILHEFGHYYLDDTFVRAIHHYNERLVHPDSAFIMESLNRDRLDEFADLHRDMICGMNFKKYSGEGKKQC